MWTTSTLVAATGCLVLAVRSRSVRPSKSVLSGGKDWKVDALWCFASQEQVYYGRKCCKREPTAQYSFWSRIPREDAACDEPGRYWVYHVVSRTVLQSS